MAGLLANLSENLENMITIVEAEGTSLLVELGGVNHIEVQQDVSRALANLASNEENHTIMFHQGGKPHLSSPSPRCLYFLVTFASLVSRRPCTGIVRHQS